MAQGDRGGALRRHEAGTAGARQGQFRPTLTLKRRDVKITAYSPRPCSMATWMPGCLVGLMHQPRSATPYSHSERPFGRGPGSRHGSKIAAPNGGHFVAVASTLITLRIPAGAGPPCAALWAYWRVNTAWTVMVLFSDAIRSRLYVRAKSALLTGISAPRRTSSAAAETFASKESGRVRPRTVRLPVSRAPPPAGWTPSTVK